MKSFYFKGQRKLQSVMRGGARRRGQVAASALACLFSLTVCAQQAEQQQADRGTPVVVQPGAPGQPTRTLPLSTSATLPPGSVAMSEMPGMDMSKQPMLMPGMLTPKQMEALKKAKGAEFDQLFLTGMIQHHGGALIMVKDLFDTAGAGQDAELFNFATDIDSGQRAEIRIMQTMLGKHL